MDPISSAASIIAILGTLSSAAEAAKEVWAAPDELQVLASELSQLTTLANAIIALTRGRNFREVDLQSLQLAFTKLQAAQILFDGRLSKRHELRNPTSRFRRRTWILHRSRIKKLTKDVIDIRNGFMAAMMLLNLSTVIDIQDHHHTTLSFVARQQVRCDDPLGSHTGLEIVQENEQTTPGFTLTTRNASFGDGIAECQGEAADLNDFLDAASQFSETVSDALPFYTPCASLSDYSLETSGTFYPEQYVTEGPSYDRLAVFSMLELKRNAETRVDKYFLLYAKDARHWSRVTVTATTTADFTLSIVSSHFLTSSWGHMLPGLVRPQLEAMLRGEQLHASVTNVCVQLRSNEEGNVTFDTECSQIIEDLEEASAADTSKHVNEIEQRGLPQYLESEVILLSRLRTHLYRVLVESQQYIERKLPFTGVAAFDRKPADEFVADMKLFQMAQGCPGVAKFVGVVLDDDRKQLCSYLLQYPEQGSIRMLLMKAKRDDTPIPWARRERWIRQIIEAIVEIHKRGIFVGSVDLASIWVDAMDNIEIIFFKSMASGMPNRLGGMPPELRRLTPPQALATGQSLTFQSDIFQLGLVVWMLAEQAGTVIGIFCQKEKGACNGFPHYRCTADHTNPVELPRCGGGVPEYINEIVGYCRQEHPCQRKPASALLRLLPTDKNDSAGLPPSGTSPRDRYFPDVACDSCGALAADAYYHCSVCHQGDFDLCPKCVSAGIFCYDDGHKLTRRVLRAGTVINDTTSI